MRISDWSSDVCSSDFTRRDGGPRRTRTERRLLCQSRDRNPDARRPFRAVRYRGYPVVGKWHARDRAIPLRGRSGRSEEHMSELQSLMRIPYAVFCLKKKTNEISTTCIDKPSTVLHQV